MKVFYVTMKRENENSSIFGYIIAESMAKVLEIAPYKVTDCAERGDLLAIQGTIDVAPVIEITKVVETTPQKRNIARWRNISGN